MARGWSSGFNDDDWSEGLGWSRTEELLFENLGRENQNVFEDELLQQAFDLGWFDMNVSSGYREAAREFVVEWLDSEYGVQFDDVFDWQAWREAYG